MTYDNANDIKIVTKLSYCKVFLKKSFEKNQVLTNKPFYLVLSTLHLSKTVMHEFCMIMETKIWHKDKTLLHGYFFI